MAKAKKTAPKKAALKLSKASLIAAVSATSASADVNVDFTSGIGQVTAILFRMGLPINQQSISSTGSIHFSDVQRGDAISVNGVCSGKAAISVSGVSTDPSTVQNFEAENIHSGFDIL